MLQICAALPRPKQLGPVVNRIYLFLEKIESVTFGQKHPKKYKKNPIFGHPRGSSAWRLGPEKG
jgi:hypothetical protein